MALTPEHLAVINAMSLDDLLLESAREGARLAEAEEGKKAVNARILSLMTEAGMLVGQSYFRDDGINARIGTRVTKTINRQKLIESNVDPAVVEACTDINESAPFITVTVPKPKK